MGLKNSLNGINLFIISIDKLLIIKVRFNKYIT